MTNPIMKHFEYGHLPRNLQVISKQFHLLAHSLEATLPNGPEKSVALRKILEGKDAAVRAALEDCPGCPEPKSIGTVEEATIVDFSGVERAMKEDAAREAAVAPPSFGHIWAGIVPRHDEAIADLAKDMDVPPHSAEGWEPLR